MDMSNNNNNNNNNNYMFGPPRPQNPLDILPQSLSQQGASGIQMDMSQLGQPLLSANCGMTNPRLQQGQQGISSRQPLISPMPPPPQPQQLPPKRIKETVLKTALSLLNEICSKAKTMPTFTLEETGPVHSRVYKCTVTVEKQGFACEATAVGQTKKEAKQEAAKSLLLQMDTQVEKLLVPKAPKAEPVVTIIEVDAVVEGNPVGELNDLCTKLKRLPPEYEDVSETGKPHEKVYTVSCKLGKHIAETGRGRSKKHAKKVAAHRVHKLVLELLAKENEGVTLLKDEDNFIEKLSTLTLVSKQEAKKFTEGWKLTDWVANLQSRAGPKLDQLKKEPPVVLPTDNMKLLKEIADEQSFKIEFTDLDRGNKDLKACLIAVSAGNLPIAVLMGSAATKTQAKKNAAENFIEMLRVILTSKSK